MVALTNMAMVVAMRKLLQNAPLIAALQLPKNSAMLETQVKVALIPVVVTVVAK
jgi:hypothetical protein